MGTFTVDTHLFRELGQLLVGRDSTALVELVKNAYDADADEVIVHGEALDDPARGFIRIQDSGVGMTAEEFRRGFLRIASRVKDQGDRSSPKFGRRYTGAKGIGRLAAHKLARHVEIESVPWRKPSTSLSAKIDWDKIEAKETLDDLDEDTVQVNVRTTSRATKAGTTILLKKLRQRWTPAQLTAFLAEVEGFQPSELLVEPLDQKLLGTKPLFGRATVNHSKSSDPGFRVKLDGAFAGSESYWPTVAETAHWLLEIDAGPSAIRYAVIPLKKRREENDDAAPRYFDQPHPDPELGPFFQARILVREGAADDDMRIWSKRAAGIRVFMEGFRVLPYGEPSDDWLEIERDTTERAKTRPLRYLSADVDRLFPQEPKESLLLLPRKHYFGAVFLTQDRATGLQMLINREGFVPDRSFVSLRDLVRRGVDLLTRVRASVRGVERDREASTPKKDKKIAVENAFVELESGATALRNIATSLPSVEARRVETVISHMEKAAQLSKEYFSSERMTRVLASVGLQLSAFTHEMTNVITMAQAIEVAVRRLREREGLPAKHVAELGRLAGAVGDLRRVIERQAAHLMDVVTPDARRRRARQNISDRFSAAKRFVERAAEERGVEIKNDISSDLRSPLMFQAELATILTNLLTNAVKAAGENGRIRASGDQRSDGTVVIRIENTGVAVDLDEAERWFKPFESTTIAPDPLLGQGMGLGLTITRDMLAEIGASIEFVSPRKSYATALQIAFPKN